MPHLAAKLGLKSDESFQKAYWKYFEEFFGKQNSAVVKAMLLAKNDKAKRLIECASACGNPWGGSRKPLNGRRSPPLITSGDRRAHMARSFESEPGDDQVVGLLHLDFRSQ